MKAFTLNLCVWSLVPALLFFLFADLKEQFALALTLPLVAFALGFHIPLKRSLAGYILGPLIGFILIIEGITFNYWLPLTMSSWSLRSVFILSLLAPLLLAPRVQTRRNIHPVLKFLFIAAWLSFLYWVGFGWSLIALGLLLMTRSDFISSRSLLSFKDFEGWKSFFLGAGTIGLTLCIFKLIYLSVFPVGYEGFIYLIYIFGIGEALSLKLLRNQFIARDHSRVGVLSIVILVFFAALLFGGSASEFHFDFLNFYLALPSFLQNYEVFACLLILALFTPLLLPVSTSKNDPSSFALGAAFAGLIQLFFLRDLDLYWQIIFSASLYAFAAFFSNSLNQRVTTAAVLLSAAVFLPHPLDEHALVQGQRLRSATWWARQLRLAEDLTGFGPHLESVLEISRSHGSIGNILNNFNRHFQGYGAFTTNLNDIADYQLALAAKQLLTSKPQKILILGLGNQIVVREISAALENKVSSIQVVDNFPPLFDSSFGKTIAEMSGFDSFSRPEINIQYDDAFAYLASVPPESFDMIIWNLSWPNFSQSGLIYTAEFGTLLHRALKPNGSFVGFHFRNQDLDCSLLHEFKVVQSFPYTPKELYAVLIASKAPPDHRFSLAYPLTLSGCSSHLNHVSTPFKLKTLAWGEIVRAPQELDYKKLQLNHDPFSLFLASRLNELPSLIVLSSRDSGNRSLTNELKFMWSQMERKDIFIFNSRMTPWSKQGIEAFKESYPHSVILNLDEESFTADHDKLELCNRSHPNGSLPLMAACLATDDR